MSTAIAVRRENRTRQNIANAYQKDFDKGWSRDSSYIYGPSLPRSYFVGLKVVY